MIYQEIWKVAHDKGLTSKLETTGKTPWQSLGARLYVEVRDNEDGRFIKVGSRPTRFFIKERASELPADAISKLEKEEGRKTEKKTDYNERDLHPLLAYYANSNPSFNRGRSIYTKTIMHEKSTKGGYNEWIHPDMVGFYLPIGDWQPNVINKLCEQNRDFDKFLQDVRIDYESKRIHRAEFDDVSKDIAKYIKEKMKIEQGI